MAASAVLVQPSARSARIMAASARQGSANTAHMAKYLPSTMPQTGTGLVSSSWHLVVLAGFLVVIPPAMIAEYRNRMINIHPSLIPSFCGKGYYGLKVHEAALERGVKVVGATVHFVDEGTDTGPIILQKAVEVEQGDTPEKLQRRVMEQAEWKILPRAIDLIANGRVKVENNRTIISE